ncbi:LytTR family transcriptional regulator DNA-binding domain-containing protein [bacterium]|nr:LytTR family transcriptional regulator DNA-binding domain-containing protein [bacterium]
MSGTPANRKTSIWPKDGVIYIETVVIILLAIVSMSLQYGRLDSTVLLSPQLGVRIFGSLCVWFANKFTLDYILQSRIDSNKVSQFLPFEMTIVSVAVTSIIYLIFYPILLYLNDSSFVWAKFLKGLFVTSSLSLLIVIFYAGIHIWKSWWSDGEFLFRMKDNGQVESEWKDFITIKNSREDVNIDLNEVSYFISEFKIVFLVDRSGKKRITQYNLSELEKSLDDRFFRLNRRILVSRQIISFIKKLPNHRLLVTIGQANESHKETISRYKSTRFKQWLHSA